MKAPKKAPGRLSGGFRRQDSGPDSVDSARAEGGIVARRERARRRAARMEELGVRSRGAAMELRRRLRPLGQALLAFLQRIAPPLSGALFAVVRALALAVLRLTEIGGAAGGWLHGTAFPIVARFARAAEARITPVTTLAVVAGAAAITLGISQFLDYHGVAVGARYYEGRIGTTAPVPLVDLEHTGSAHLYVMVPLAAAALVLIALTATGRRQWGWAIGAIGIVGLLITVAVDVPQGLDAGTAGAAYDSADAELLKGFWIQLTSCAVLAVFGPLLGSHVRAKAQRGEGLGRTGKAKEPERGDQGPLPELGASA